jgi:hypothetical protein
LIDLCDNNRYVYWKSTIPWLSARRSCKSWLLHFSLVYMVFNEGWASLFLSEIE